MIPTQAYLRGVIGTDMKTYGKVNAKYQCNNITHEIKLLVTELGSELILGLELFNLISIADVCVQQQIDISIEALHITGENEADYTPLKSKWEKHLPLGKKTGDAFKDLTLIFPSPFDSKVGLSQGEVNLKTTSDDKAVQLPPCTVPLCAKTKGRIG